MNIICLKFLSNLFDLFDDSILICDDDFSIQYANKSAWNLFNLTDEIIGQNFFSQRVRLLDDDFESFVEKIFLKGNYSSELLINLQSDYDEVKKFTAIRFLNEFDQKYYYLFKISSGNNEKYSYNSISNYVDDYRKLAIYLQNTREEERAKIARELHDDIGQLLTILKMDLQSIVLDQNLERDQIISKVTNSISLLDETISVIRKMISELRLAILDHLGLVPAIEHLIEEFVDKTKIKVNTFLEKDIDLPKEVSVHLFRVCQELFTNIRKHSKAKEVEFIIKRINGNLLIIIKDDGIGFNKNEVNNKNVFGLIGIRERIYILNGNLDLETEIGKGTKITITIPLNNENTNSR